MGGTEKALQGILKTLGEGNLPSEWKRGTGVSDAVVWQGGRVGNRKAGARSDDRAAGVEERDGTRRRAAGSSGIALSGSLFTDGVVPGTKKYVEEVAGVYRESWASGEFEQGS